MYLFLSLHLSRYLSPTVSGAAGLGGREEKDGKPVREKGKRIKEGEGNRQRKRERKNRQVG